MSTEVLISIPSDKKASSFARILERHIHEKLAEQPGYVSVKRLVDSIAKNWDMYHLSHKMEVDE